MRLPTINHNINVAPVQELVQHIRNVEAAKTYSEFCLTATAAKTCLQTLKSTNYITAR